MLINPPVSLPTGTNHQRKLFITADEHYYHKNVIKYLNRPFDDVDHMNSTIIDNHNSVVSANDHVIHIGDCCLSRDVPRFFGILARLNGIHYMMDGSHDDVLETVENTGLLSLDKPYTLLPKLFEFKYNGHKIVLCHYAMARWWSSHHGSLHFYGHSHGKYPSAGRAMDVGVDVQNFFPVRMEDAINAVKDKPLYANHPKPEDALYGHK